MKLYLKAIIAFAGVLCTGLGSAATDGGLSLAEVLTVVGGSIGTSGLVAAFGPEVKRDTP